MKRCKPFGLYAAVFAGLLLALYLVTVLFAAIPNEAIQKNMRSSARYFANADYFAFTDDGLYRNVTDNYADQIWTNIGWNLGHGNPFEAALNTGYYNGEGYPMSAGLHMAVTQGHEANVAYTRYWHGSAAVIRLLHLATDIQGIKTVGLVCLLLLSCLTVLSLCRGGHWELGLCVVAALLCVQMGNLRLSVEYMPSFLLCMALCPAFIRLEKKGDVSLHILCIVSGTVTAFFDFLTTETVTLLFPLILVLAIRSREQRLGSPGQWMKTLVGCCLCWGLAYGCTFLLKWVAASAVTGENQLWNALSAAENRLNGSISAESETAPNALLAIGANFSVLFGGSSRLETGRVLAGLSASALALAASLRIPGKKQKLLPETWGLLLLGGAVLLRYGVLTNHSYLHSFFTYRALASTVLAALSAVVINLCPKKGSR